MRIALINSIRPQPGSGDGMTEYTYQLYLRLSKKHKVDLVFPLDKSKKNDVAGLTYTYLLFGRKIKAIAKKNYDIIHITNHEMGFAARILKEERSQAKVVTTIHDLMRLKEGFNKGFLQDTYNKLVARSVKDSVEYSDHIIFSAQSVEKDALERFKPSKRWITILLGPRDNFVNAKVQARRSPRTANIGYVGALSYRKNVMFILKTALLFKGNKNYKFTIYGSGPDQQILLKFKEDNRLDNVKFMGFAPEEKLLEIYDSFDLFLYPTLEEGSSLPILDAQSRGLPVVIVRDNKVDAAVTRHCFTAKNEKEAQALITELLHGKYSESMRSAEIRYSRRFSWDNITKETEQVYRKVAKG